MSANLMQLIDEYAEARHLHGSALYNSISAEARANVLSALEQVLIKGYTDRPIRQKLTSRQRWQIDTILFRNVEAVKAQNYEHLLPDIFRELRSHLVDKTTVLKYIKKRAGEYVKSST